MIPATPESEAALGRFLELCWLQNDAYPRHYQIMCNDDGSQFSFIFRGGIVLNLYRRIRDDNYAEYAITAREDRWWISHDADRLAGRWLNALWPRSLLNDLRILIFNPDIVLLKLSAEISTNLR